MNARLYPAVERRVNDRDRVAAIFRAEFADQPDLSGMSPKALRVLSTAAALFYERGAVDTSVRELTRACGLTPGALYNHFASKNELLYTVVWHGHRRMQQRIDAALAAVPADSANSANAAAPVAMFAAFVRAYVAGHVEHPELAQTVRREYVHLHGERYTEIVELRRATRNQVSAILAEGQRRGCFSLIGGRGGAVGSALMVLDMCSRTSDWYDRSRDTDAAAIVERYVAGALRLVGGRG